MNSTNIKVMSEEIQHLKNEVHNLDVEIPAHPSTDVGKYLGVVADGSLSWSKVPDELPPTTGATAGQILALDNNKAPEWIDSYNLDYSEIEHNTNQKWINGKDIFRKVLVIPEDTEATTSPVDKTAYLGEDIETLISYHGVVTRGGQSPVIYDLSSNYASSNNSKSRYTNENKTFTVSLTFSSGYFGGAFIIAYYTKPTPSALTSSDPTREAEPEIIEEPEPETKSTRTKKSTK